MKKVKKIAGVAISTMLLLIFSVTILPLDLLHSHTQEPRCSVSESQRSCDHKVHVTKKSSYCWVCAVHFEKSFTRQIEDEVVYLSVENFLSPNLLSGSYDALVAYSALRGPPVA